MAKWLRIYSCAKTGSPPSCRENILTFAGTLPSKACNRIMDRLPGWSRSPGSFECTSKKEIRHTEKGFFNPLFIKLDVGLSHRLRSGNG